MKLAELQTATPERMKNSKLDAARLNQIALKGSPRLLIAFGRSFPSYLASG